MSLTDIEYLKIAAEFCRRSDDPVTQNGAILVSQGDLVPPIMATNSLTRGLKPLPERLERPAKYRYIEHAERAAIHRAARTGFRAAGATLYCVWFACPDCARAIVGAGVHAVIGSLRARAVTPERWLEQVEAGEAILREAGVSLRWIAEPLGVKIRFNGEDLHL